MGPCRSAVRRPSPSDGVLATTECLSRESGGVLRSGEPLGPWESMQAPHLEGGRMVKRILTMGLAVMALALVAPAIGINLV